MVEKIVSVWYRCTKCNQLYYNEDIAKLCEAQCSYGKHHNTEEEWRAAEPETGNPPGPRWTAWSNYGLSKGW